MRRTRLFIALAIVLAVLALTVLAIAPRRTGLTGSPQTAAAALLEFQAEWATNGDGILHSRGGWPAGIVALGINSMEVGITRAGGSRREDGPLGIWWSQGYQIQRQFTNDNRWSLYRTHAIGIGKWKGLAWRGKLAVVTNTASEPAGRK
jgi:hypothetical protein